MRSHKSATQSLMLQLSLPCLFHLLLVCWSVRYEEALWIPVTHSQNVMLCYKFRFCCFALPFDHPAPGRFPGGAPGRSLGGAPGGAPDVLQKVLQVGLQGMLQVGLQGVVQVGLQGVLQSLLPSPIHL